MGTVLASAEERALKGLGCICQRNPTFLAWSFLLGQSAIRVGRPNSSSFFWGNQKDSQDEGSSPQGDQPDNTHPPTVGVG